jgi:glycosyltransferase involved in cell wall biosynthesis
MRRMFGIEHVSEIPTGVNIEYFTPPASASCESDLIFIGSMDWLPNEDGVLYFVREILPLIRRRKPKCRFTIAGRHPSPKIAGLARDPGIVVTGTVPDIRPYLWGSRLSIVPLRIGGGTRMKIYESMAARVPVVSTTVGAEGLVVESPVNIRLADTPEDFAAQCLELLDDSQARSRMTDAAWELVASRFSWDHVARCFEKILEAAPEPEFTTKALRAAV